MKSGLEDRNNEAAGMWTQTSLASLNEVRPGRPEQCRIEDIYVGMVNEVSMKSGLEDRNNDEIARAVRHSMVGLNEVRPGRPEQFFAVYTVLIMN